MGITEVISNRGTRLPRACDDHSRARRVHSLSEEVNGGERSNKATVELLPVIEGLSVAKATRTTEVRVGQRRERTGRSR